MKCCCYCYKGRGSDGFGNGGGVAKLDTIVLCYPSLHVYLLVYQFITSNIIGESSPSCWVEMCISVESFKICGLYLLYDCCYCSH